MEKGKKLCDVLSMEVIRVGDPPKELPPPVDRPEDIKVSLSWPYGNDFPWPEVIVPEIPEPLRGVKVPEHWHGGDNLGRPNGPLAGDIVLDVGTMQRYVVGMSPDRRDDAHNLITDTLLQMVKMELLRKRKLQNRTKKMRGSVIRNRSKQSFRKPR